MHFTRLHDYYVFFPSEGNLIKRLPLYVLVFPLLKCLSVFSVHYFDYIVRYRGDLLYEKDRFANFHFDL